MSNADDNEHSPLRFLPTERHPLTLHPEDAAAVDALFAPDTAPKNQNTARQQRVQQWLGVCDSARVHQPPADLLARTLAAVQADKAHAGRARLESEEGLRTRSFSLSQQFSQWVAIGLAAALLIAVLIPGLNAARQNANQVACAGNLGSFGQAFATYAAMDHDELPALAPGPDDNWLPHDDEHVHTRGHSNTANLLPLVRASYINREKLFCPAREATPVQFDATKDEIPDSLRGYSYLDQFGPARHWDHQPTTIILADRNPLFDENCHDPFANSCNHRHRGENVLTAAQNVEWVTKPDIGPAGDDIWTIGKNNEVTYTGSEEVQTPQDIFLAP